MTRKDYIRIAAALNGRTKHNATDETYREGWHAATSACAHALADTLAQDNPRFDRERFLKAAGVQS